ncbi:MAG: DUF4250 domain-containing protein [Phocaeicola sp.]|nr:DUF4250 domain-containing protein [Phocaeicola sp.]
MFGDVSWISLINKKLRDEYDSLVKLCETLDIDQEALVSTLWEAGFGYTL